jgi:drug/metabolite transporter (DMT)-like permease
MNSKLKIPINLAIITVLLAAITGGGNPVFIKIALKEIPVFAFNFLRFFISLLLILPLFLREKPKITRDVYKLILLSLLPVVNITLFAFGIKLTTATNGQMIHAAIPIVTGIMSYFFLKEMINRNKIMGIIVGFVGAIIIVLLPIIGTQSVLKGDLFGNVLIFLSMFSWASYIVLSKKFHGKYSPVYLNTFFILTATVVEFFPAIPDFSLDSMWWQHLSISAIFSVFYVSALGTVITYVFYQYAIKHGGPVTASTTQYVQPIATFVLASIILGEKLTPWLVIGSILVLFGTWMVTKK